MEGTSHYVQLRPRCVDNSGVPSSQNPKQYAVSMKSLVTPPALQDIVTMHVLQCQTALMLQSKSLSFANPFVPNVSSKQEDHQTQHKDLDLVAMRPDVDETPSSSSRLVCASWC